ncbi:MAG: RebB family R body protein [Flavobacteriales bacterium]|nr:RebB family R body protein [Flavobacteriales bacterium]
MAFPTAINSQITDAITQVNTKVLGDAPATAMGNFMIATSQALSNAAHNATSGQQQASITAQAATTQGITTLFSIDTASTGVATQSIFQAKRSVPEATEGSTIDKTHTVTKDTVIGHIRSKLYSPAGKKLVEGAILQARESPAIDSPSEVMKNAQSEIEEAIQKAKEEGLSNQSIGYALHQVAEEKGINLLYPAISAPDLTVEQVEAYYKAMIAAHGG